MDENEQNAFRECYQYLESSLDAQAISGALFSRGIISMEQMEELSLVNTTRFQKNGILLRCLMRSPVPTVFSQLCEVLSMEEANRHLARTLQGQQWLAYTLYCNVHLLICRSSRETSTYRTSWISRWCVVSCATVWWNFTESYCQIAASCLTFCYFEADLFFFFFFWAWWTSLPTTPSTDGMCWTADLLNFLLIEWIFWSAHC